MVKAMLAILVVLAGACGKRASGGTGSCMDVFECYRACPDASTACTSKCDALGTEQARTANLTLLLCMGAHACKDVACVTEACSAEMQACANAGSAAPATKPAPAAPAGPVSAVADQDFVFVGADGLTYVPELHVVANGVALALPGVWRETKRNITLELGDGTYTLHVDETAWGTGGVSHTETGEWRADAGALVVTPGHVALDTSNHMHEEQDEIAADPPRTWVVEGVTVEWTTMGEVHEVRRADGLVISGPRPTWTSGPWTWTLRRAK